MRLRNPVPSRRHLRRLAAAALLALLALACSPSGAGAGAGTGAGSGLTTVPTAGCAPAVNEHLDPRSTIHLFASAKEPVYLTDPPTSGPHLPGLPYRGALTAAIPRPSQVAMLESGFILLQYRDLPADQTATLANLADNLVTVAPAAGPLPTPVVATAWTWKLECASVTPAAVTALRAFVTAHRGVGFGGDLPTAASTTITAAP
jgi:hypothetical protein